MVEYHTLLRYAVHANDQVYFKHVFVVVAVAVGEEHVPDQGALRLVEPVPLPGLFEVDDQDEVHIRGASTEVVLRP